MDRHDELVVPFLRFCQGPKNKYKSGKRDMKKNE